MPCTVRSRYALVVLLSLMCLAMQTPRTDNIDRLVQTDTPFTPVSKVYRHSHALLIGINKYKNRPKSAQLAYADNDVTAIKQMLIDHYGFEKQNVVTLLDEQATFDAIRRALAALSNPRIVDKQDRVLVFFAGHGQTVQLPDNGGPMGFLIPYDADPLDPDHPDDPTTYQSSCLPMNFVWSQLQSSPAKHILLLADACYSGLLAKSRAEGDIAPQLLSVWSNMRAMEVITGGSAGETTVELESKRHGAFTHQLLEALRARSAATGSVFTTTGLFASLQSSVPNLVASVSNGQKTQTPQMGKYLGAEGEFLFIPTGQPVVGGDGSVVTEPVTVTELGTQAELVITSEPAGATVTIDDENRGTTPLRVTLDLDLNTKRTVQVGIGGLPGYKAQLFTVEVFRGKSVTVPLRQLMAVARRPLEGNAGGGGKRLALSDVAGSVNGRNVTWADLIERLRRDLPAQYKTIVSNVAGSKVADGLSGSGGNTPVTLSEDEIYAAIRQNPPSQLTTTLENFLVQDACKEEAEKQGITVTDRQVEERIITQLNKLRAAGTIKPGETNDAWLSNFLTQQHMTREKLVDSVRLSMVPYALLEKEVSKQLGHPVGPDDYVQIRQILIKAPAITPTSTMEDKRQDLAALRKAQNLAAQVKAGKITFAQAAKEYNEDFSTKKDDGVIAPFMRGSQASEIETEAFMLEPNEVSKPIRTQVGYYLIAIDKQGKDIPEDKRQDMLNLREGQMSQAYLAALKKRANIINNLPPVPAAATTDHK